MAVTYTKNSRLQVLKHESLKRIHDIRNELFDPKNSKTNGIKGAAYGAGLVFLGLSAEYLSDEENREFTKSYLLKAFGLGDEPKKVPIKTPISSKVAGVNAPKVNEILKDLVDTQTKTTDNYNKVIQGLNLTFEEARTEKLIDSETISNQTEGASPFLNNQLYWRNEKFGLLKTS